MTPEQIALVQTSFKSVAPIASKAADLFYDRLFESDSSPRLEAPCAARLCEHNRNRSPQPARCRTNDRSRCAA
jgi:hypothetical protein